MARSSGKIIPLNPTLEKGGDKSVTPRISWGRGEIGGPRHEYRESLLFRIVRDKLQSGSAVLDAGCGSGSLLFKLAALDCKVYGIEQSKEYVEILQKEVITRGISNIGQVKYGSVTDIPYPDKTFDLIVSGDVLEHVKDDVKAVKEFYRVLRHGGFCVVSVPALPSSWDFSDDWAGHLRRYTKEGLVSLFKKTGFVVEDVRFWGFPFVRLYHRLIYLPYVKKKMSKGRAEDIDRPPDAGKHKLLTSVLRVIFYVDSLFRWIPYGTGLTLRARK